METTPYTYNSSLVNDSIEHSPVPSYIYGIQGFFTILGLFGNILIIVLHVKSRSLRKPGNVFIIALATADVGVLCGSSFFLGNLEGVDAMPYVLCMIQACVMTICTLSSLVFMACVAVVRYICIVHPAKKQSLLKWKWCILVSSLVYVLGLLFAIPIQAGFVEIQWIMYFNFCIFDWKSVYSIVLVVLGYGLSSTVIGYCYVQIFKIYKASKNKVSNSTSAKQDGKFNKDFKLALQLLTVYIIYNVCWGPYIVLTILVDPYLRLPEMVHRFFAILTTINSVVNFYVYLLFNSTLRLEFRKLFRLSNENKVSYGPSSGT